MPMEARSNNALFRRAEQLKRWEESETNKVPVSVSENKKRKIEFSEGCVFLAACSAGDTEEVESLLAQNADINTANVDGLTALHQACIDNNLDMVQFLVEHNCDVNRGDNEGWTPLHATASCGFISIARYLIENRANIAAVNNDGDLPIDIAECSDMEEFLSEILDKRNIDCEDARSLEERLMLVDVEEMSSTNTFQEVIHPRTGASALHVAAAKGYMSVLRILVQLGSDLNAQDNDGWTPLHASAHWGQKDACAVLADSLANMNIQNLAGQTCFDVAEPELIKLLEELKKKQTSLQEDKPEIQAILQRTSQRPPLRRRTSVTRMSGQEKSKSVMKDTKAERAKIENLTLSEDEESAELAKERLQADVQNLNPTGDDHVLAERPKKLRTAMPRSIESKVVDGAEPSWKRLLRRASETSETPEILEVPAQSVHLPLPSQSTQQIPPKPSLAENLQSIPKVPSEELEVKRHKRNNNDFNKLVSKKSIEEQETNKEGPFIPPLRDDESELQRKAHAKRVRETRRSTQGVLLEDIKSAELQYLISAQQDAAKRQADETAQIELAKESSKVETEKSASGTIPGYNFADHSRPRSGDKSKAQEEEKLKKDVEDMNTATSEKNSYRYNVARIRQRSEERIKDHEKLLASLGNLDISSTEPANQARPTTENTSSGTTVPKSRSPSPTEDLNGSDKTHLGTQAAIQRRRRPKRRSTGVVYLESDVKKDNKSQEGGKEIVIEADNTVSERIRLRYGSSIPDVTTDVSATGDAASQHSSISYSQSSLNEGDVQNFKKLYDEVKKENERLKDALKSTEEELEKTKKQMQKLSQNNAIKSSLNETEKKEKRSLERKLSEMEEEMKHLDKLRADNERLKNENSALIRVISKLSK